MKHAIAILLLASLATAIAVCCSETRRPADVDASTADNDVDSDTDTGSNAESDTDTGTGEETWTWHWEDLEALDLFGGYFVAVAGTSTTDVVTVGGSYGSDDGAVAYNGTCWHLEYTCGYSGLIDLCVTGDGTYYAVGDWSPQSPVLRREGGAWSEMAMPEWWQPDPLQPDVTVIADRSPTCLDNGFVVLVNSSTVDYGFYLASHDDTGWATLAWPGAEERWWAYSPAIVAGESADNLHIYGTLDYGMPMEGKSFDGESFSPLPVPETHGGFYDVHGDAEHGWWAVGYRQPPDPGTVNQIGAVWFSPDLWSWEEVEVPHPDPETYNENFWGVWASSKGDVFVVGAFQFTPAYDVNPVLLRFDGSEWEQIEVPPHPESDDGEAEFWDVWGAESEVFAVGSYYKWGGCHPAILHYGPE